MSKKTSPLEDLIDIASRLPWYICLLLAVLSYFVLHHFATANIAAPHDPAQISSYFSQSLWKTMALIGQYVLAFSFTLAAVLSLIRCKKREQLYTTAQSGKGADVLNGMSWKEFEILVGEAFRRKGFSVRENYENGPDGGVDLVLFDGSDKYLVQCKQWRAFKVGVKVVRELFGVMASSGAVGGFVVTSGEFTKDAKDFAQGKNIELIDGPALKQLIQEAKRTLAAVNPSRLPPQATHKITPQSLADPGAQSKLCPKCGKEMVLRVAKQGANAGQKFWGCKGYPQCKTALPLEKTK